MLLQSRMIFSSDLVLSLVEAASSYYLDLSLLNEQVQIRSVDSLHCLRYLAWLFQVVDTVGLAGCLRRSQHQAFFCLLLLFSV